MTEHTEKDKDLLLEKLSESPIISAACKRAGIGRATYYRWRNEDPEFATKADTAIKDGRKLVSDMAESQVISLIREKSMPAIGFWLRHNDDRYKIRAPTKIEEVRPIRDDPPSVRRKKELELERREKDIAEREAFYRKLKEPVAVSESVYNDILEYESMQIANSMHYRLSRFRDSRDNSPRD